MPDILTIDSATWSFEEGGVRFFLLAGSQRALLIDSGMQTRNARDLARGITDLPLTLLNTHADPDHIGSNGQFDSFLMNPAEATNYYKTQGRSGRLVPVWDGDVIDLGGRPLRIIALPGHTPGSIAVLDVNSRRLFSGDPVQDGRIFMFGPQRELHAYVESLRRLMTLTGEFDAVYPSHGTCPVAPSIIPELIEAAETILSGGAVPQPIDMFGRPVAAYKMLPATFLCDA